MDQPRASVLSSILYPQAKHVPRDWAISDQGTLETFYAPHTAKDKLTLEKIQSSHSKQVHRRTDSLMDGVSLMNRTTMVAARPNLHSPMGRKRPNPRCNYSQTSFK